MCNYEISMPQSQRRTSEPTAGGYLMPAPARDTVDRAAGVTWGNLTSVCGWGWSKACNSIAITC